MNKKIFKAKFDKEYGCTFTMKGLDLELLSYICSHILKTLEENSEMTQEDWAKNIISASRDMEKESK